MAVMDVLNIDCFTDPGKSRMWFDKARGFSVDKNTNECVFNGGIVNPQREHLRLGQFYYRFVSRSSPHKYKTGGVWWIDADTLNNIYQRYRAAGPNPMMHQSRGPGVARSTFREWLALTFEWNLIEEIVIAPLMARVDSYSGFGRPAQGGHAFDNRGYGYAPHLSNLFTIKQHCVPELWVHQAQAFPSARIVPFSKIEDVAAGRIV